MTEREEFEAFYRSPECKTIDESSPIKGANYVGEAEMEFAWQFWQACRRTTPDREAWRPIETAPKDGKRFMAWHKGRVELFRWQGHDGTNRPVGWRDGFIYVYSEGDEDGPTHWMPLPTAPNGEKK